MEIDKAYEPAQDAILRIMARWLGTLTIEERKRVKGIQVTFDAVEGDTFTARLLSWEDDDAGTEKPDAAAADERAEADGPGVRAGLLGRGSPGQDDAAAGDRGAGAAPEAAHLPAAGEGAVAVAGD
jgi:hypothetical protein